MDVVVVPVTCACGRRFEVECQAHVGTRVGYHEFRCPSCGQADELPNALVRVIPKDSKTTEA
jgi:predicted RNA-binding Zn-ribbon protein involved in translation (DUF1610 family)